MLRQVLVTIFILMEANLCRLLIIKPPLYVGGRNFFLAGSIFVGLILTGCIPLGKTSGSLKYTGVDTMPVATLSADGEQTSAMFSAGSNQTQVLAAASGSPIEGVEIMFPAGSLAIDTSISVGPGADIVDASELTTSLGVASTTTFSEIGSSISINSEVSAINFRGTRNFHEIFLQSAVQEKAV
jgi:hypothetical protein